MEFVDTPGTVYASVTLRGVDVYADVLIDRIEDERRHRIGTARRRLASRRVLHALLSLPERTLTPIDECDDDLVRTAQSVPGAVECLSDGSVRRIARTAACVLMVNIPASDWKRGMKLAERFACYCTRQIVLDEIPSDYTTMCMEADYWGVGVRLSERLDGRELVHPQRFVAQRYTEASWNFEEDAYAQLGTLT
jgi:hypothetical protein